MAKKKEVRLIRREKLELLGHLAVEIEDTIQQIVAKINYEKKLPEGEINPQPYEKVPELLLNVNLYHQELLQEANRIDNAIRSFIQSSQNHKNINLSDNNDPFFKFFQEVLDAKKAFMNKLISLSKFS